MYCTCQDQPADVIQGNNGYLFWESYEVHKLTVYECAEISNDKLGDTYNNIGILRVKY
jgi:hypothetical protein